MKRTLICVLTHRGIGDQTRACLATLVRAGAELLTIAGASDVAFGRSALISSALEQAGDRDTLLLIDDDMVFRAGDAERLVAYVRDNGVPASAVYPTAMGQLAAIRNKHGGRPWLTGLGFFAVGVEYLASRASKLPRVWVPRRNAHITAWCESYASEAHNEWVNEDMDFCLKLGGVDLLPIAVGHVKQVPLYADSETLEAIANGDRLPTEPPEVSPRPKDAPNGRSSMALA